MLKIEDLTIRYHGMPALSGVNLQVEAGERTAFVGPNGGGKSSLLKAVSGTVEEWEGQISFEGTNLAQVAPHDRVEMGIIHIPEGRRVFSGMSVRENLLVGAQRRAARPHVDQQMDVVRELFPTLMEMLSRPGESLSGGQQQMLAIARGLMGCPRLLMLDEPSMGLSPLAAETVFTGLGRLEEFGEVTLILVEQRAPDAFELCETAHVFESGSLVSSGRSADLAADGRLAAIYLGEV
ncbi:ABC transporter ATP-binding protein [Ornithinimicrobium ciconiae]|uniref:ABC transporter ATP-binding protein n=1 Tax=Ornithinimicrobium ciconiae TaxID=2594265 RepID=A0A516G916_9MICO|nr:ABC transporter ATP-binding protein [Ornithinimicrobium ciconiae]QDO88018.1 ABC transporter ATP-binding protein [Ornithinimicrobium ciconiae]